MIQKLISKVKNNSLEKLYNYSIYKRLIWCFVVVFVLPIILIGGFNALYSFSRNQDEAKIFLEESTSQISTNIASYLFHNMALLDEIAENQAIIHDLSIYKTTDWREKSEIENRVRLVFGNTLGASGAISTSELVTVDHSFFYYPSPVSNGDFDRSSLLSTEARQVTMQVSKKEIPSDRASYIVLTRGIYKDNQCLGNIVSALDLTYFNKACYENVSNLLNEVIILDKNKVIVSASNVALVGTTYTGNPWHSMAISTTIEHTNLTIVNSIAQTVLLKSALLQLSITLLTALLFAVLAFFLAIMFAESISRPINRLMNEMNKPEVDKYVEDDGDDEYHKVIVGFNKMSGHIVAAIHGQYKSKLQKTELRALRKEAELSALQQQINPHFLYNTLESIYWSGQLEGDEEISSIVSALGDYLRAIIDKGRAYVTIATEVASVNNYIFLQNKRFGDRIQLIWDIPSSLKTIKILKLAIHPVVEDIIAANLDDIEEMIHLTISIVNENENVTVDMTGEAVAYYLNSSDQSNSELNGINSVDERLTLYYGDAYGVTMDLIKGLISVRIPVYHGNEGDR